MRRRFKRVVRFEAEEEEEWEEEEGVMRFVVVVVFVRIGFVVVRMI